MIALTFDPDLRSLVKIVSLVRGIQLNEPDGFPGSLPPSVFPPGPQLPPQPLRALLQVSLLGEQRHDGSEQFA